MKFYIVSDTESGTDDYDGLYFLVAETGELVESWISSNKSFARNDLYFKNKKSQDKCKILSIGSDIEIVYLGEDSMTNDILRQKVKLFIEEHY